MADLHELSALELAARFADRSASPVDAVEASLARIAAWEPMINAMYRIDGDGARAAAREAEARWRAGNPRSPLDGVPITIKDNISTRGDPTPVGTRANEDGPIATEDAPPAARVREAGCVILGKTTMPDFGMLSSGLSSLHGLTRNPWNTTRNTSGSSSGAGAAAAAGYAPLHLGTDIGGSVRLPATHCGIFALKPSAGRVPVYPPFIGRVTGPMTRNVDDAAALLNVIARPDARDFMDLPASNADWLSLARGAADPAWLAGLRIGLALDTGCGLAPHPEIVAATKAAARALEAAGAKVEPLAPYLTPALLEGMQRFFEARSYNDYLALPPERQKKVLPFIVEWCTWRAKDFTGRDVMAAYNAYVAMRDATISATREFDFVLSPTSPILPYEAELPCPGNDPHDALPHIGFTVAYNMSEQPAASLNWSASKDGLPIGVQLAGRRFDDGGVLRLARLLEGLRPAQAAWPEPKA